jgi:hypothetical protein
MNPNEVPVQNADPRTRAINPAYGKQRPPEKPLNSNPSHQPHECCGRIFQSKELFDNHFASVHQPFLTNGEGISEANPSYIAPENANTGAVHGGLPYAEHRAGGFAGRGHSTGLAATEKFIPVPESQKHLINNPEYGLGSTGASGLAANQQQIDAEAQRQAGYPIGTEPGQREYLDKSRPGMETPNGQPRPFGE